MSKNIIFYSSGTGNCLDMARNIASVLGDTDLVSLRNYPALTDTGDAERVGFVFPCYGGGAPVDFLEHVKLLTIHPGAYTFAVSQSSSYAGTGLYELNKLVKLDYWKTVTHQCSCIWLFPHTMMVPPMSPEKAQRRAETLAKAIAGDVLSGVKTDAIPPRSGFNAAENAAWPKIAALKAKGFAVSDACIGCGQCARLCPRGNINMKSGRPDFGTDCVQCLSCLQYCPKGAISLGRITDVREHYHNPNVSAADLMEKLAHID